MAPYVVMHDVLQGIRNRDLQPALEWIAKHKGELSETGNPTDFHFQLHRLQFLHLLEAEGPKSAMRYARENLSEFALTHMCEVQRLMGCLLFPGRLASSPYSDLLSSDMWDSAARELTRQSCGLQGQASDSPLLVTVAAGEAALPQLLKLTHLLKEQGQDLSTCDEMPVELELGPEFVFHSIFACPVSRDQSTPSNPPTMLPCGHVLCKQSVIKISKGASRSFKCPYCPKDANQSSCRQITFPDAI
mmetsp:Transcript_4728/g.11513  ORF Transcript_4728/g.11513 Transcript_4728/m.11513 type:complete len:246 (+) Transcript_4728:629-1366(+)